MKSSGSAGVVDRMGAGTTRSAHTLIFHSLRRPMKQPNAPGDGEEENPSAPTDAGSSCALLPSGGD